MRCLMVSKVVFEKGLSFSKASLNFGMKLSIKKVRAGRTDNLSDKVRDSLGLLKNSIEIANQAQLYPLGASDMTARVGAALGAFRHAKFVISRNGWDAKNAKHSQEKYNKMIKELHLDIMGEGRKADLYEAFDRSIKTGDYTDFVNKYSSAWIERLCFGYTC